MLSEKETSSPLNSWVNFYRNGVRTSIPRMLGKKLPKVGQKSIHACWETFTK